MTFAASANAVVYTGATPVFVDALAEDGNVSPDLLLSAVNSLHAEGIPVAAVMTVDLFGRCVDYPALVDVLADHGIPLIEDAAEALGASKNGKPAGSFGRAAALSFNGNKIMTTSGGGMLLSDDLTLLARARYLSSQARQPVPHYEHTEVGYNYRLSNVLAALGRAQLTRLDSMIARRREIRAQYVLGLSDIPGLRFLGRTGMGSDREDNCWLTCITLDPTRCPISADTVIKSLAEEDIEARHLWKPMHLQPVFAGARAFLDGTAEHLFSTGLTLPSGSALREEEVNTVIDAVRAALGF
jgi:dTDP-4-amino-4,6-dideoxygalactose transaminase